MLWLIRNDNNSSRPADHTIDGQRQPEESIKGYWPSVKLVLKKYNFNIFFFLPDFSCYKLFSLLSLCREGTLLLCIFCNFHGIALWALRIYLASRFPNLFYAIFSFAIFYFFLILGFTLLAKRRRWKCWKRCGPLTGAAIHWGLLSFGQGFAVKGNALWPLSIRS